MHSHHIACSHGPVPLARKDLRMTSPTQIHRRQFMATTTAATATWLAAPAVLTARKTDQPLVVGQGEHRYQVQHEWAQLPTQFHWQTTHNVAVDSAGLVYVIHEGAEDLKDHPSIFVFDPSGRYVRSFGQQFQ